MRDKLAEVIEKARNEWHDDLDPAICLDTAIADAALAWLREYLGSDEVVERACKAGLAFVGAEWDDVPADEREMLLANERASLSSIMEQSDGR
jgi:hypothetical protein